MTLHRSVLILAGVSGLVCAAYQAKRLTGSVIAQKREANVSRDQLDHVFKRLTTLEYRMTDLESHSSRPVSSSVFVPAVREIRDLPDNASAPGARF